MSEVEQGRERPIYERTASELANALERRELTSVDVTSAFLERLAAHNAELRAFLTITPELALERAARADEALDERARLDEAERDEARRRAPILGLPIGDKDLVDRAGVVSTYGSRAMAGYVPPTSSRLVRDLDAAGAVSLGKTNTPEFGFPSYTENLLGAPARNPWNRALGPGGSSGGAAVAVAARLLPFAPGSDGGGSIRIPAAACGLVGLKPSRGRVPGGSGVDALAGLPVAGPIARTAVDAALLLDAMVTSREPWPFALRAPGQAVPSFARDAALAGDADAAIRPEPLRIGVSTWSPWAERYDISVEPEQLRALAATADTLESAGHEIVRLPDANAGGSLAAEGAVDGTGYAEAFRAVWRGGAAALPLDGAALDVVEPLTAWLVRTGRELPVAALSRALAYLADFESRVIAAYSGFDVVLTPALAMSPRPIGWYDAEDGERNFAQQVQYTPFTSYVNVTGLPAIALPVAHDADAGVPVGVQAIGRPGREDVLLRLAAWLEKRFGWAERVPPLDA